MAVCSMCGGPRTWLSSHNTRCRSCNTIYMREYRAKKIDAKFDVPLDQCPVWQKVKTNRGWMEGYDGPRLTLTSSLSGLEMKVSGIKVKELLTYGR